MASSSSLEAELTWAQRNRIRSSRRRVNMSSARTPRCAIEISRDIVPELATWFDTLHPVDHLDYGNPRLAYRWRQACYPQEGAGLRCQIARQHESLPLPPLLHDSWVGR
jgi:hypothetical protein